jgi:hypothetical protein
MNMILERDLAKAQTVGIRDLGRPVLKAVIDYGVGVFERCSHTAPDGDTNLAILMQLHHALEMLDGVEVLLDSSCVVAARTPLRSAFEASLGLRYVLQSDVNQRAMAYLVTDLKDRIDWYGEMDPETDAGRRFRKDMGVSEETSDFPFPTPETCRAGAARLRSLLESEDFKPFSAEYDAVAAKRKRPPWYSLFRGPGNLRELAIQLGEGDNYLILYRTWSKTTHAVDLYRQLTGGPDGTASVRVIRSPVGVSTVYLHACSVGVESARVVLEHYRPAELEQHAKWFMAQVNPRLKGLEAIDERESE